MSNFEMKFIRVDQNQNFPTEEGHFFLGWTDMK